MQHRTAFVATEGELLAGDHKGTVWQQCGYGRGDTPPAEIAPDVSLSAIVAWTERLVEVSAASRWEKPTPDPDTLYPSHWRATMPEPAQQFQSALSVQLTRAEKQALDLLAAWPLCTTEQLAGLMGGVTRRRANQVLRSLTQRSLVGVDGQRHVLTGEGLKYLARRDRAAVGTTLARWSAEHSAEHSDTYAGTSLRALASQPEHQDAVTGLAAALTAGCARSLDHGVLDLRDGYRYCLLEFERRATTPKRVRARLENYRRYFQSGWAERDHGGRLPLVLFVFETPDDEDAFLRVAGRSNRVPLSSSNLELLTERGVLGDAWRLPPPNPADRLPLHHLDKVQFCLPGRSRHFL